MAHIGSAWSSPVILPEKRVVHCPDLSGSRFFSFLGNTTEHGSRSSRFLATLSRQSASSLRSGAEAFWSFQLRDSKKLADEFAALVRQGIKTATCSVLMGYEKDETPLPQKLDLSIVLDGIDILGGRM